MDIGVKEIDRWHRARGWDSCGYHYVIRRSGKVETGRPVARQGAHVGRPRPGWNRRSIGVCLIGGIDKEGEPADNYTKKQYTALVRLVRKLREAHDIVTVIGHRDLPGVRKACPCFDVADWVYRNF